MEYLQAGLPWGLLLLIIGGLISVKVELSNRPTFKDVIEKHTQKDVCDVIHKNIDEKLSCLPEIKTSLTQVITKIDIILKKQQ